MDDRRSGNGWKFFALIFGALLAGLVGFYIYKQQNPDTSADSMGDEQDFNGTIDNDGIDTDSIDDDDDADDGAKNTGETTETDKK